MGRLLWAECSGGFLRGYLREGWRACSGGFCCGVASFLVRWFWFSSGRLFILWERLVLVGLYHIFLLSKCGIFFEIMEYFFEILIFFNDE